MFEGPWVCFHCGEVCNTREEAEDHFGLDEEYMAACVDPLTLDQKERRAYFIGLHRELDGERDRSWELQNELDRITGKEIIMNADAIRKAEEDGYARGVRDMKAQGYCVEPNAHKMD